MGWRKIVVMGCCRAEWLSALEIATHYIDTAPLRPLVNLLVH